MDLQIISVEGIETLPLRQKILKPFATVAECAYPEDNDSDTYHWALKEKGLVVGVATFLKQKHPDFSATCPYRLRGMAIDRPLQGQGWGGRLLQHGISDLEMKGADFVWFNAREKAFHFYARMSFIFYGEMFELPGIGPHKVMYKRLTGR